MLKECDFSLRTLLPLHKEKGKKKIKLLSRVVPIPSLGNCKTQQRFGLFFSNDDGKSKNREK